MRKIYDPFTGADVTSSVQSALQSGTSFWTCQLYSFECFDFIHYNPYGNYMEFAYTDADINLWLKYAQRGATGASQLGTYGGGGGVIFNFTGLNFLSTNISYDKFVYGIGLEDNPVEVSWYMDPKVDYMTQTYGSGAVQWGSLSICTYPANLTLRQALAMNVFTECPFWIHTAIFSDAPSRGGTFLGTTLMFRGYIRSVKTTKSAVKLTLASLMDVFQSIQVPTQTMTPNNRALPYIPAAASPYMDGGIFVHYSGGTFISPVHLQVTTTFSMPTSALRDSYMSWAPAGYTGAPPYANGKPPAPVWRIEDNSAGPGVIDIWFYEPYIVPVSIANWNFYAQLVQSGGSTQGFLNIPPPEFAA